MKYDVGYNAEKDSMVRRSGYPYSGVICRDMPALTDNHFFALITSIFSLVLPEKKNASDKGYQYNSFCPNYQ